jgi:hypothetical protein
LILDRLSLQPLREDEVVVFDGGFDQAGQFVRIHQVGDAHAAARDFVFIRRTNAAAGGADGFAARGDFARLIDGDVVRHDQRRCRADLQARTHVDALRFELFDFLLERGGRQHDAVTDEAQRVVAQNARRDQVQHGLLALDDQGVAGVVTALEARDGADAFGQQVDDFAFAFVAPLCAKNYD